MTPEGILETHQALGETTHIVSPAAILNLCGYFKKEEQYNRLSAITAVDWHPAEPRFEVIYHLHSVPKNTRLRLKCRLASMAGGANPEIESVYSVWRSADWFEREVFDMFGIRFANHPNLQRILMPLDWEGYPLRKDYPVHGYKYSYPSEK